MNAKPIPVWLDCDTGHDDAFAILVAALHPRLHCLGISTVYGNAPVQHTTHNTLSILTAIKRDSIPVYAGSSRPLCRAPCFAAEIHGSTGLDGTTCLPEPSCTARTDKTSAIQAMYDAIIARPEGEVYIVATGALTNIALLFAVHPQLVEHVGGVHIMGGAVGGGYTDAPMGTVSSDVHSPSDADAEKRFGNWTPFAEFNIWIDPEAAKAVLENEGLMGKMMLVPLDVSHLFRATADVQMGIMWGFGQESSNGGEPKFVRRLFHEILMFFAHAYAEVFGIEDGPPLHDVLPMLGVLAPEVFDDRGGERYKIQVVIDGKHGTDIVARTESQVGRTICTSVDVGQPGVRIPRNLDRTSAWNMIDQCLASVKDKG